MSKALFFTPQLEQSMVAVWDAALKAGGLSIFDHVALLKQAVQMVEDTVEKVAGEVAEVAEEVK